MMEDGLTQFIWQPDEGEAGGGEASDMFDFFVVVEVMVVVVVVEIVG